MNKQEMKQFYIERKKRLANKDEVLHRTASGEIKLTAQYWEIKGQLIRSGDKGALAAFEDEVDEYKRLMTRDKEMSNLTVRSAISRMAETKVEKFLLNTGYTAEALALEHGLNQEEILNPENWRDDKFFASNGMVYAVKFNYNGSIFEAI